MLYLHAAPDVRAFYSQPRTIQYLNSENRLVKYTTDLRNFFFSTERPQNVEVKAEDSAAYIEIVEKKKLLAAEFFRLDEDFELVSTEFTDKQPELNNRQLLHIYGGILVPSDIKARVTHFFEKREACTIGDFLNVLGAEEDALQYIYALIFQNNLFIDMGVSVSAKSNLSNI